MDSLAPNSSATERFTAEDLRDRARGVLIPPSDRQTLLVEEPPRRSDFDLNPEMDAVRDAYNPARTPAAVLVPVVDRRPEATVLFTQRPSHMRAHAGQISFPGGRMEEGDTSPAHTALRETHEETGIEATFVEVIGFLESYQTSTGFRVAPAVGIVSPKFTLSPDPGEVEDVFEVPLRFLMSAENHELHSRPWRGSRRYYYAMPYEDRYIWGATAGMLRNLYDWLYR